MDLLPRMGELHQVNGCFSKLAFLLMLFGECSRWCVRLRGRFTPGDLYCVRRVSWSTQCVMKQGFRIWHALSLHFANTCLTTCGNRVRLWDTRGCNPGLSSANPKINIGTPPKIRFILGLNLGCSKVWIKAEDICLQQCVCRASSPVAG